MVKKLFTPVTVGQLTLPHRIVMAPMTRFRSTEEQVPKPCVADFYAQRAKCQGLLITEATSISPKAAPFSGGPGIYSRNQVLAWEQVVKRVHETGGKIFMQLWHAGREVDSSLLGGDMPVSSSAVSVAETARRKYSDVADKTKSDTPRALQANEIKEIVDQFVAAAQNAVVDAGFDGVEINAANGYLVDQFLRDAVNKRTDSYGGSIQNRCNFALEILHAVTKAVGPSKVGIRLNPFGTYNNMSDSDPISLFTYLFETLNSQLPDLAYVHLTNLNASDTKDIPVPSYEMEINQLRKIWTGTCILNRHRLSREKAIQVLEENEADLLSIGYNFIANPDLPLRLSRNLPLNSPDGSKLYTNDEVGYTDYPFYEGSESDLCP